ncbi:MAG: GH92 family glycosyl hydrolase [Bacteroidetes bacterium]|nr:GH92 family glycosyl hydrolase [Bacteroidota bacterium]
MCIRKLLLVCSLLIISLQAANSQAANYKIKDYSAYVNPMIGTGGHGHTFPGAAFPFGMMQLSPDTRLEGWDGCSGYHFSDSIVYGFSHTHLSGTGCSDYGDFLFMPFTGKVAWKNSEYADYFNHNSEQAIPGLYKVHLNKSNIDVALAVTARTGMHRYEFATKENNGFLIDLTHRDEVLNSWIEVVNDTCIRGYRSSKAWATNQQLYFYAIFNQPISKHSLNNNDTIHSQKYAEGKKIKAALFFDNLNAKTLLIKVGISSVSCDGALKNLQAENQKWNFDDVAKNARQAWNKELSKIQIEAVPKTMQLFYTSLFHCMIAPNIYSDIDGQYRGRDDKIHSTNSYTRYTVFSLWDTYRALNPLLALIDKKRTGDFVNTFIDQYKEGKLLPVWELSANETFCMIGYHAAPVITDAWMKDVRSFDVNDAYKAMRKSGDTSLYGLDFYKGNLYLTNDVEHESVSKNLEYAYDDWCVSQMAKVVNELGDMDRYTKRSLSYRNLFDNETKFIRGRTNGTWYAPFNPREVNNYYTEANAWQYNFYVPHDMTNYMNLYGGKDAFASKLDQLFTAPTLLNGRQQADITGLVGQYAHGNEPSHQIAYLYDYCDQPYKTQYYVNRMCTEMYNTTPDGLCGNEDCGQMSAWYVLSALGLYEVCPGNNQYSIGTPQVDEAVIYLENGKSIEIKAAGREKVYIDKIKLNKKVYSNSYFEYNDLKNGAKINFTFCDSLTAASQAKDFTAPHTEVVYDRFIEVPVIKFSSRTFFDSLLITVEHPDKDAEIYVMHTNKPQYRKARLYTAPFYVDTTCFKKAFAKSKKGPFSAAVQSDVFEMIKGRNIKTLTKYDPQYDGGGDLALIDGIHGDKEFRKGSWQGYSGVGLEAIVDLGKTDSVHKVAATFLHDQSPWIFAPREMTVYQSNDGVHFDVVASATNNISDTTTTPTLVKMKVDVSIYTRYIKVVAPDYGKLPPWHLSPGEPAWLFVDEIDVH